MPCVWSDGLSVSVQGGVVQEEGVMCGYGGSEWWEAHMEDSSSPGYGTWGRFAAHQGLMIIIMITETRTHPAQVDPHTHVYYVWNIYRHHLIIKHG